MNKQTAISSQKADSFEVVIKGSVVRRAQLKNEYYEYINDPDSFINTLKSEGRKLDIFTFVQRLTETEPKYTYKRTFDSVAILPLSTFDDWWKISIKDKIRNSARKAAKNGVRIGISPFNEELILGIQSIYNESPTRQGKPFWHYGKDLATIERDHATFLDRSVFITAYLDNILIGFIKLVHGQEVSSLMQIISTFEHRRFSPTDALLTEAVRICTDEKQTALHYGSWSERGLGSYKTHRGFTEVRIPRYHVATSTIGRALLRLGIHQPVKERIPINLRNTLAKVRSRIYSNRQNQT